MARVGLFCLLLILLTTVIHYEVLRLLSERLPPVAIPARSKLLVVFFITFIAHAMEIVLYGVIPFLLVRYSHVGTLNGGEISLFKFIYFSAETYSSLGYGDLIPSGPLRLLAGVESLNGLLLIGWSASYIHIAMERFWNPPAC
ncbi:MAG: potassium channel family protein [Candidatus Competibacter denitrificans]